MATEIEKLTRYAPVSTCEYGGHSAEMESLRFGDWFNYNDVIRAVAAIKDRHTRELTSIILALREFGRTRTGHLDGDAPCYCRENGALDGFHFSNCKNMPLRSANYVRDLVPIIEKLQSLVEHKR